MDYLKIDERLFLIFGEHFFLVETFPMKIYVIDARSKDEAIALAKEYSVEFRKRKVEKSEKFSNFVSFDWLITSDCNLNCKHCFAKKENELYRYGIEEKSLKFNEIQRSIALALEILGKNLDPNEDSARMELFIIGGEPTLEKQMIMAGIDELDKNLRIFEQKHQLAKVDRQVMIVSNGIEIDDEFAYYLYEKNIGITISVDAPGYMQKVDSDGNNHTPRVIENIKKLLDTGNKNISVNFVISPDRLKDTNKVFDYLDCQGILKRLNTVQMSPQIPPHRQTKFCGCKSSEVVISDFGSDPEKCELFAEQMLGYKKSYGIDIKNYTEKMHFLIEDGGMAYRCPAAQWKFCVIPGGDIYPCHQLVNIEGFKMGNINDDIICGSDYKKVTDIFEKRMVFDVEPCKDCPMQTVCITFVDCPARCFLENGNINRVPEHYCKIAKKYLESIYMEYLENVCDE